MFAVGEDVQFELIPVTNTEMYRPRIRIEEVDDDYDHHYGNDRYPSSRVEHPDENTRYNAENIYGSQQRTVPTRNHDSLASCMSNFLSSLEAEFDSILSDFDNNTRHLGTPSSLLGDRHSSSSSYPNEDISARSIEPNRRPSSNYSSYSYSSSSYRYSNGDGRPVVRQTSHSSTRVAQPGREPITETVRTIRDSRTETERMAMERSIGERSRMVTKERVSGGTITSEERLSGFDNSDQFDREWNEIMRGRSFPRRTELDSTPSRTRDIHDSNPGRYLADYPERYSRRSNH